MTDKHPDHKPSIQVSSPPEEATRFERDKLKKIATAKRLSPEETTALEGIHASVDFLLRALADDLDAPVPSKEPAFLQVANDRVCLVRSLVDNLESIRDFLAHFDKDYPLQ